MNTAVSPDPFRLALEREREGFAVLPQDWNAVVDALKLMPKLVDFYSGADRVQWVYETTGLLRLYRITEWLPNSPSEQRDSGVVEVWTSGWREVVIFTRGGGAGSPEGVLARWDALRRAEKVMDAARKSFV